MAVGNQNELQYLSSTAVRFQGSLRTIGSGVAWGRPGRSERGHTLGSGFLVPKVPKVVEGFGCSKMFRMYCAILDANGGLEVWQVGEVSGVLEVKVSDACEVLEGLWTVPVVFEVKTHDCSGGSGCPEGI